jgi:hypothetical protein
LHKTGHDFLHRQCGDFVDFQGGIACQPAVLGRDLSGSVDELPGRIRKDGGEPATSDE